MTFLKVFTTILDIIMVLILLYFTSKSSKQGDSTSVSGFVVMLVSYVLSLWLIWN